jgi:signal transduction histidine kinase
MPPERRLPTLRTKVLIGLLAFGFVLCLFIFSAVVLSTDALSATVSAALLLFLLVLSARFLADEASRDVRHLAHTIAQIDLEDRGKALRELESHIKTAEVRDVADFLQRACGRSRAKGDRLQAKLDRAARGAAETSDTLSNFMYYIAHVLRTPVNEIRWSVETLKNEEAGDITEPQREMLDRLERSSVHLANLASDLQDTLLILRDEPLRMRSMRVNIETLLDEVAGRWAVPARRRRLRLVWKRPEKPTPEIIADPVRLARILDVILENAVRYSREDSQEISVSLDVLPKDAPASLSRRFGAPHPLSSCVMVSVVDHGIGVPAREQALLFTPFFRGSNARELWVDGKGIGLVIASAVVREHGGDIWVKSRENRGTTVRFCLPFAER